MTNENNLKNKFAFFGTPQLAVEILDALAEAGYLPALIVTMPDRAIEVLKPEKLDAVFVDAFKTHGIDFSIVVAYGKILPQALLDLAPMYNIHYSLLPRWRGATPVESVILAGDAETGVAIQRIVHKLDAGPLVAVEKTPIGSDETAPVLRSRLNDIAKKLLVNTMPKIASGDPSLSEQDDSAATSCGKMSKEDGLVDLADDGLENYRKFRAYFGWPGIHTYFERGGKRIRTIIVGAHLEGSKLILDTVKPEGKGEMPYQDFLRSGATPV